MTNEQIRDGMTVRTAATLATWSGMGAGGINARWRRTDAVGIVERTPHPWADGCWLVRHDDAPAPALYREHELTPERRHDLRRQHQDYMDAEIEDLADPSGIVSGKDDDS